jgi:hypothetical protein
MLSGSHLIQTKHLSRRVVELVMVDFDVCEGCIELHVDVALPRRELEGSHGERIVGYLDVCSLVLKCRMRCVGTMYSKHAPESRGSLKVQHVEAIRHA